MAKGSDLSRFGGAINAVGRETLNDRVYRELRTIPTNFQAEGARGHNRIIATLIGAKQPAK
jgi:hypothetical protein